MVFLANCIRPVYVVKRIRDGNTVSRWLFHDPNAAQAEYIMQKTVGHDVTLSIETLKFEGWKVVG